MAELILVLSSIAAAVLAAIAWLESVGVIGSVPKWMEPTAVLIATILILIGFGRTWRTARQ